MQFISVKMITTVTSGTMYLVHRPAKSSMLADFFNPDPREGGRYGHPHFTGGVHFFRRVESHFRWWRVMGRVTTVCFFLSMAQ